MDRQRVDYDEYTGDDLDCRLAGAVISGGVGIRKSGPDIYQILLDSAIFAPEDLIFSDDRGKKVSAARAPGIETSAFDPASGYAPVLTALEAAGK
ncbi:MAG: hypothetical protein QNJ85_12135 [Gammaproteobacteria bacterium]|nr:hypothetical protein [Gammaproteobacteria bacterium]